MAWNYGMIQISGNFAIGSNRAKISRLFKFEIWKAEGRENAMKATGRKKKPLEKG